MVRTYFSNRKIHGSQRCLGPSSHSKTKHKSGENKAMWLHKFKTLRIKKLSKSGLRRFIKFGQAHSNDERKITLSLNLHFILDFRI